MKNKRPRCDERPFRNEWKYYITEAEMYAIRARLLEIMERDSHAGDGKYLIRSLYFAYYWDKSSHDTLDGINYRNKDMTREANHRERHT